MNNIIIKIKKKKRKKNLLFIYKKDKAIASYLHRSLLHRKTRN